MARDKGLLDHRRHARRRRHHAHRRLAHGNRSAAARLRRRSKKSSIASAKSRTSTSRPTTPPKGETPATILPALIRKYPNVYVLRDFSDPEAAKLLLNEVRDDDRLVITNVHAKDAPEALLRMLQQKVPQREFAARRDRRALHAADSQAVRRLQSRLRADARPAEEARHSGRARSKRCTACRSRKKSKSRARSAAASASRAAPALFELLVVDDKIREILVKQPKLDLLRKAARPPACDRSKRKACCWWPKASRRSPNCNEC